VAQIGNAFGMKVIAWSQNLTTERAAEVGATLVAKDALFQEADVVTIHLVLSGRMRGLVGAAELALMKPTARLINTSRGPIVVEADLIAALKDKTIAGASIVPEAVEDVVAASLPVAYLTAEITLTLAGFKPGMTVLAPGISGSVGNATYQLARAQGASDAGALRSAGHIFGNVAGEVLDSIPSACRIMPAARSPSSALIACSRRLLILYAH
jgi:hypothetical protein